MANIVAKLAEKTDAKMAGKYGGVEPLPHHSRSGYNPVNWLVSWLVLGYGLGFGYISNYKRKL